MFAQSRNFYENNMILMFVLSDSAKSGLESSAWIDGYDYQNRHKKNYHYEKNKSVIYSEQCIVKKTMWFHNIHPVISAILDDILDILQRWNTTTSCQSNSPNATTVENYQKKGY